MYDARSEAHEFVADTREEAVAKAVQFFGVKESSGGALRLSFALSYLAFMTLSKIWTPYRDWTTGVNQKRIGGD